jgi:hypothetical protein
VPFTLSWQTVLDVVHAIVIGGIVAVKYLWWLWLFILALWVVTRLLRMVYRFLGLSTTSRPRSAPRPRR